jgi:hypothetical protein
VVRFTWWFITFSRRSVVTIEYHVLVYTVYYISTDTSCGRGRAEGGAGDHTHTQPRICLNVHTLQHLKLKYRISIRVPVVTTTVTSVNFALDCTEHSCSYESAHPHPHARWLCRAVCAPSQHHHLHYFLCMAVVVPAVPAVLAVVASVSVGMIVLIMPCECSSVTIDLNEESQSWCSCSWLCPFSASPPPLLSAWPWSCPQCSQSWPASVWA